MDGAGVESGVFVAFPTVQDRLIFRTIGWLSRCGRDYECSPRLFCEAKLCIFGRIKRSQVTVVSSIVFLEVVNVQVELRGLFTRAECVL